MSISVPGCASAYGCASEQGLPFRRAEIVHGVFEIKLKYIKGYVKAKCEG